MNIHQLTETEASYLLFAIKKTLRDRPKVSPLTWSNFMIQLTMHYSKQSYVETTGTRWTASAETRSRDSFVSDYVASRLVRPESRQIWQEILDIKEGKNEVRN